MSELPECVWRRHRSNKAQWRPHSCGLCTQLPTCVQRNGGRTVVACARSYLRVSSAMAAAQLWLVHRATYVCPAQWRPHSCGLCTELPTYVQRNGGHTAVACAPSYLRVSSAMAAAQLWLVHRATYVCPAQWRPHSCGLCTELPTCVQRNGGRTAVACARSYLRVSSAMAAAWLWLVHRATYVCPVQWRPHSCGLCTELPTCVQRNGGRMAVACAPSYLRVSSAMAAAQLWLVHRATYVCPAQWRPQGCGLCTELPTCVQRNGGRTAVACAPSYLRVSSAMAAAQLWLVHRATYVCPAQWRPHSCGLCTQLPTCVQRNGGRMAVACAPSYLRMSSAMAAAQLWLVHAATYVCPAQWRPHGCGLCTELPTCVQRNGGRTAVACARSYLLVSSAVV